MIFWMNSPLIQWDGGRRENFVIRLELLQRVTQLTHIIYAISLSRFTFRPGQRGKQKRRQHPNDSNSNEQFHKSESSSNSLGIPRSHR